jgi:lipoate synthase
VCGRQKDAWNDFGKDLAKKIDVGYVVSGPLVRSSFQAKQALEGFLSGQYNTG